MADSSWQWIIGLSLGYIVMIFVKGYRRENRRLKAENAPKKFETPNEKSRPAA